MNYITLEEIKQQIRYDQNFNEDDSMLMDIGDGAESFLEDYLDTPLDEVAADNNGELPKSLKRALLILVSYLVDNDGSGENRDVPNSFFVLTRLYKKYPIA